MTHTGLGKMAEGQLAETCPVCGMPSSACPVETRTFDVDNLGCANCAAKMEESIARLPRVEEASLTFTTGQLRVTCPHPDEMCSQFQEICRNFEPDVVVRPHEGTTAKTVHHDARVDLVDDDTDDSRGDVICILVAAVLFVVGLALEMFSLPPYVAMLIFLVAYLVAGFEVLAHAARNIVRGKVFDENFLMSVATFGAIAVQQYPEAVGVMLFYRIGELFEDRAVARSRSQIMDAVDMRPETVNLLEDYAAGTLDVATEEFVAAEETNSTRRVRVIGAQEAKLGDLLLIRPGERIPLDGTVVEGVSRLDTSPITGEPLPRSVQAGSAVISGCINTTGLLVMRVDKVLADSMVTRILDSVENAAANKPQIQRFITRFARVYTPAVIVVALVVAFIPSLITGEWPHWIYTACTFLVISCPCAIVLSVPLSFFAGIGAASKIGVLFKGGNAIEALKNIRTVVMDKTGTITRGEFSVVSVNPAEGVTEQDVLAFAASAERASTHPIAASIVMAARERGLRSTDVLTVHELAGKGVVATFANVDDWPDEVLCGNRRLLRENGVELSVSPGAVSETEVFVAADGRYIGAIRIADEPKGTSAQAISLLRARGIHPIMLTGDAEDAAHAVAEQVGIEEVHARLLPQQKLDELYAVRRRRGAVMFVGDGINDAPVLAGADVGAAMGSGSDAAIEAADMVLMNSSLEAIPQSLRIARAVNIIAMENIVFALVVKMSIMILGLFGVASMWAAVFADVGVAMICILNSVRILYRRY